MSAAIIFCFIELLTIALGAVMVSHKFYTLRDGLLRKLMIWYFAIEVFTYVSLGVYLVLFKLGVMDRAELYFIVILLPKLAVKIKLIHYIIFNK